jgi:hypothetical protein
MIALLAAIVGVIVVLWLISIILTLYDTWRL